MSRSHQPSWWEIGTIITTIPQQLHSYTMKLLSNGHFGTSHNFTVIKRLSSLRGKIVLPWSCRDHRTYPLYRGVLYLECPLREVPLYCMLCVCRLGTIAWSMNCRVRSNVLPVVLTCVPYHVTKVSSTWGQNFKIINHYHKWYHNAIKFIWPYHNSRAM